MDETEKLAHFKENLIKNDQEIKEKEDFLGNETPLNWHKEREHKKDKENGCRSLSS